MSSMRCSWLCGISRSFLLLSPAQGQVTYVLLTRSPLISKRDSFDLHVLGTPPAFILSQDQTLDKNRISTDFHPFISFPDQNANVL